MLARRVVAALDSALLRVAPRTLEIELLSSAAALSTAGIPTDGVR
jgi:hypothetical protein